jgi:hypothetical protein
MVLDPRLAVALARTVINNIQRIVELRQIANNLSQMPDRVVVIQAFRGALNPTVLACCSDGELHFRVLRVLSGVSLQSVIDL